MMICAYIVIFAITFTAFLFIVFSRKSAKERKLNKKCDEIIANDPELIFMIKRMVGLEKRQLKNHKEEYVLILIRNILKSKIRNPVMREKLIKKVKKISYKCKNGHGVV